MPEAEYHAHKYDADKPDAELLLLFGNALLGVAEVGTYGNKTHAEDSWREVPRGFKRYTAALLRHLFKEKFELRDSESKIEHAKHVAWNALARLEILMREQDNKEDESVPF